MITNIILLICKSICCCCKRRWLSSIVLLSKVRYCSSSILFCWYSFIVLKINVRVNWTTINLVGISLDFRFKHTSVYSFLLRFWIKFISTGSRSHLFWILESLFCFTKRTNFTPSFTSDLVHISVLNLSIFSRTRVWITSE